MNRYRRPRISHGIIPPLERLDRAVEEVRDLNSDVDLPFSFAITSGTSRFDYLLPGLQTDDALLPESPEMKGRLVNLGATMVEPEWRQGVDSLIPSAYTYFGQFVDHDITLEAKSENMVKLSDADFRVLTPEEIKTKITNGRTPGLDLDNLYYKPAPRNCSRMVLGFVSSLDPDGPPPARKNDLPRRPPSLHNSENDRAALIGDKRDDENLIIAQLHVAFLRAHNAIVSRGHTFDEARRILRRHYQWIVINDFLPRICDPWIINQILIGGNRVFRPDPDDLFMPFEFSVAAYRFGHSMVRNRYRYNANFPGATLGDLFRLTALSGDLRNFDTLPENWIIEWKNFLDGGPNCARPIDTGLSESLFDLREFNKPMPVEARLPVRNLLRGYMLRLPTGQAVASALNVPVLSPADIEEVARRNSPDQLAAIDAGEFAHRTPLWYYVLAEAAAEPSDRLGPVGSSLVSEVLIGLVRGSKDSILRKKDWQPTLGSKPGRFELRDLLELADVL
jgi:heme peroxidase